MFEIDGEVFLEEQEWADIRGLKRESLAVARCRGNDAPFIKMGRRVLYRRDAVRAWMAEREVCPNDN